MRRLLCLLLVSCAPASAGRTPPPSAGPATPPSVAVPTAPPAPAEPIASPAPAPPAQVDCGDRDAPRPEALRPEVASELDEAPPADSIVLELPPDLAFDLAPWGASEMDRVLNQQLHTRECAWMGRAADARAHRFEVQVDHGSPSVLTIPSPASELDLCLARYLCEAHGPAGMEAGTFHVTFSVRAAPRGKVRVWAGSATPGTGPSDVAAALARIAGKCALRTPGPASGRLAFLGLRAKKATLSSTGQVTVANEETSQGPAPELAACVRNNIRSDHALLSAVLHEQGASYVIEWAPEG